MTSPKNIILFVDDVCNSHAHFRELIGRKLPDNRVILAFDFFEALDDIKREKENLYCVIVDISFGALNLPDELKAISKKHWENKEKDKRPGDNYGQFLGDYLWHQKIPFFYLSAYRSRYQEEWEAGRGIQFLDKGVDDESFLKVLTGCNNGI
ncbi:MAG: hypothetical protein NTV43_15290 [Methylococcales bacterium]|nr:hypothetical protein [Methylococcales bacterium]